VPPPPLDAFNCAPFGDGHQRVECVVGESDARSDARTMAAVEPQDLIPHLPPCDREGVGGLGGRSALASADFTTGFTKRGDYAGVRGAVA